MCQDILENGTSTEGEKVRPHWEDGTSAYTCLLYTSSRIGGIGYLVLNALTVFGQIRQQPEGVAGTTNLVLDLLALGVLVFAVIFTTNVAQKFNHDTRHSEQQEQRKQQVILDDVIGVAEEVRKGTESVMKIVNDLNGSTEVVNCLLYTSRCV